MQSLASKFDAIGADTNCSEAMQGQLTSTLIPAAQGCIRQARLGAPRNGVAAQRTALLRLIESQRHGQQRVVVGLHTALVHLQSGVGLKSQHGCTLRLGFE